MSEVGAGVSPDLAHRLPKSAAPAEEPKAPAKKVPAKKKDD